MSGIATAARMTATMTSRTIAPLPGPDPREWTENAVGAARLRAGGWPGTEADNGADGVADGVAVGAGTAAVAAGDRGRAMLPPPRPMSAAVVGALRNSAPSLSAANGSSSLRRPNMARPY